MLKPADLMAFWRETKGRLPSGGRWWFRCASITAVRQSRAFWVDGHWWTGPHSLPRDEAELRQVVQARARKRRAS